MLRLLREHVMRYWVYENWRHKRARVHVAECSKCNDGKGMRGTNDSNSGRWVGRFDDRESAFAEMQRIDQPDHGGCQLCNP
jgi:hypothetical protein